MTTFRSALTALAALSVAGVTRNYDLDAVPEALARPQLPALLVLPAAAQDEALGRPRSQGFQAVAFSGGPRTVQYGVTHLLLVAPVESGRGARSHLPRLIDLADAYFVALSADVTLGDRLALPAVVRVEPGIYRHGGISYHGIAFQHTWVIEL
jgi:hypothetical protein